MKMARIERPFNLVDYDPILMERETKIKSYHNFEFRFYISQFHACNSLISKRRNLYKVFTGNVTRALGTQEILSFGLGLQGCKSGFRF
jgi:hypothetical protein